MRRILFAALLLCLAGGASAQQPNQPTINGLQLAQQAASTGTTGAVAASIPASTTGKVSYLCALSVSEVQGATAGAFSITISGLLGGSFTIGGENAVSAATIIAQNFSPSCLVASAPNTAITVTANANANATAVDVNVSGFQQ